MRTKYWLWSIAWALAALLLGQAGAAPLTIGVALPQGPALQSGDAPESLRQRLLAQFAAQSVEAVPLSASANELADREAQAKRCSYVLYTHLQQGKPSGVSGKFAAMKAALSGNGPIAAKPGDTVTLEYRLIAVGSSNPLKADSFSEKVAADGQVPSPLVAQLSRAVIAAAQGTSSDAPEAAATAATAAPSDTSSSSGRSSPFGGLFGHRSASRSIPQGGPQGGATNTNMDCAQLAGMPNAPMTADACEKFKGAQQIYAKAAADPSAARAGDEQMTCTQITAELKQQQFTAPDKTKVAEAQATAGETQSIIKKEHENFLKMQAKEQAAVNAASAADTATELATGGLVRGRALQATEKVLEEEHRANNERIAKEDTPTFSKLNGQTADFGADFASQLQTNPRLARLMQLADNKHCKAGR